MYLTPTMFRAVPGANHRARDSHRATRRPVNGFGDPTSSRSRARHDAVAADQEKAAGHRIEPCPTEADTRTSAAKITKPAVTRSGSALCGLIGFHQHLGLGMSVLSGVVWLIGSDHASFLARRRYGPRVDAYLSRRQSKTQHLQRAISLFQARIVLPRHLARASYRLFAVVNTIGAVGWGAYFVWIGYRVASILHGKRAAWIELILIAITTLAIVGIDRAQRHRSSRAQHEEHAAFTTT
jgi:membrane protein DedA with SNARE-associated domain